MQAGDYIFYFLKYNKSITIKIFPGAYWVTEEFIVGETGIGLDIQKPNFVQVKDVKTADNKLTFKLSGVKES